MIALARVLCRRGHEVITFQGLDAEPERLGLSFGELPSSNLHRPDDAGGLSTGLGGTCLTEDFLMRNTKVLLHDGPGAAGAAKVHALFVDQGQIAGGTVAEYLGLPFVTIIVDLPTDLQDRAFSISRGCLPMEVLSRLRGRLRHIRSQRRAQELLRRAALTIRHAGLNTTLELPAYGVPLVALPATDQTLVASRIEWTGTGRSLPFSKLMVEQLRTAISQVFERPSYRAAAQRLQGQLSGRTASIGRRTWSKR
jgi:hypothetical protein